MAFDFILMLTANDCTITARAVLQLGAEAQCFKVVAAATGSCEIRS